MKIKKEHLDEIFEFARKCHPIEACGILVGNVKGEEKIVEKVYRTKSGCSSSA
ncbi:MAG: Mov34/MPN/PAD-1 family protein [Candidatus Bathyarchaeia archaeon]